MTSIYLSPPPILYFSRLSSLIQLSFASKNSIQYNVETDAKVFALTFYFIAFLVCIYDNAFAYKYTQRSHFDNSKRVKCAYIDQKWTEIFKKCKKKIKF